MHSCIFNFRMQRVQAIFVTLNRNPFLFVSFLRECNFILTKHVIYLQFTHAVEFHSTGLPFGRVPIHRHLTRLPWRERIPVAGTFPFTLLEFEDARNTHLAGVRDRFSRRRELALKVYTSNLYPFGLTLPVR